MKPLSGALTHAEPAGPGSLVVKICGLTRSEDVECCLQNGVDFLGFNFYPGSKRHISLDSACRLIAQTSSQSKAVAVVVNPAPSLLEEILASQSFAMIQFHGNESDSFCARAGFPNWIKALPAPAGGEGSIGQFSTPYILLDSSDQGQFGGTGKTFPWSIAERLVRQFPAKRFFLAGGLHPENVASAVQRVQPFAVDVAGGVESSPGIKDASKIQSFISRAKAARTQA
jgi:phosphoribosylanthranilate isomerase